MQVISLVPVTARVALIDQGEGGKKKEGRDIEAVVLSPTICVCKYTGQQTLPVQMEICMLAPSNKPLSLTRAQERKWSSQRLGGCDG